MNKLTWTSHILVTLALGLFGLRKLVMPNLIKALPKVLVPLAAGGLALTMSGAIITHVVRQDPAPSIVIAGLLCAMSAVVAARRLRAVRQLQQAFAQSSHRLLGLRNPHLHGRTRRLRSPRSRANSSTRGPVGPIMK